MKIGLISDTHIEATHSWPIPDNASDVLICAGDIGLLHNTEELANYFNQLKETTEHIIWVLGNHEFYHMDYKSALSIAKDFADKNNIHLLDIELGTENLVIDGVKFWGSTLWTDMNDNNHYAKSNVSTFLNDFRVIKNVDHCFTTTEAYDINQETIAKINWDADVIVTHHSPIIIPNSKYPLNDVTYGFCNTTLEQKILESDVKVWAYGHTHESKDLDLNGTRVISNQSGYGDGKYKEDTGYQSDLIIEI